MAQLRNIPVTAVRRGDTVHGRTGTVTYSGPDNTTRRSRDWTLLFDGRDYEFFANHSERVSVDRP